MDSSQFYSRQLFSYYPHKIKQKENQTKHTNIHADFFYLCSKVHFFESLQSVDNVEQVVRSMWIQQSRTILWFHCIDKIVYWEIW